MKQQITVVLDTNVLVAAAFNPDANAAHIVEAVRAAKLHMVWNQATRRESKKIVEQIPPIEWNQLEAIFRLEWEYRGATYPNSFDMIPDPEDRKFAALADFAGAVLVTNDDHLLSVRDQLAVPIMTTSEFVNKEFTP